ncbi:hypothetical protein N7532_006864 [Penicillium argentinense]|uniref:catechol O-methyltransferase n=1 Tax=Penicillium argentinense TaxID=1131581 RepID=A0A9W9FGN0_9EURO|nr:uncharacterized protein N7532_006864 [Penicillium argentinense]KAJ5099863.1 hypothetical protein N7532_006864 [Penicillium argentinense]
MTTHPPSPPPHTRQGERSREEGREIKLLHFIYEQPNLDDISGHPEKVLDLIEKFEEDYHLVTVGVPKGKIVTDLINEVRPKTMIELGCYVGYSAILFGDAVRRNGGERYLSLELNPEFAAIANMLVDLAGLRDFVRIIVGRSDLSLDKLYRTGEVKTIELMFIDHYKPAYTTDLKLCEHHGMIVPEYVRSTVQQKREAEKEGPKKEYNTAGIRERAIQSYMPKNATPIFEVVGNPNIVYKSELHQPEGEQDAIEVSRCVAIEETSNI